MVTRPLDLLSKLQKPPVSFDAFYFVNMGLIVLFFAVFGSQFVIPPGIVITEGESSREMLLPTVSGATTSGRPNALTIRVIARDVVLTGDGKRSFVEFRRWIEDQGIQRSSEGKSLLVLLDISVPTKDLIDIYDVARKAGFAVQIAANEPASSVKRP